MKIELRSLHIESIRDLESLDLDFGTPIPHHLTTIQMPNGTGKTTTLSLLKCLFSGKTLTQKEVVDFRPTLYAANEGLAKMVIAIDGIDYTIELHLDYENETHKYYTRSAAIGGHEEGHCIPNKYKITPELVNLFVFNGEIATELFESNSRIAEQSIDCLYGLSKVEELTGKIKIQKQAIKDNNKSKVTNASTLEKKRSRLIHLQDVKEKIENENALDLKRIDEINLELKPIISELNLLQNPETRERLNALKNAIEVAEKDISVKTQEMRSYCVNPMAISNIFAESLTKLKENMDILKLPRGTSSEFFQELCDSEACICGTKMTPTIRSAILSNSSKYLSDEMAGVMNSIKTEVTTQHDDMETYNQFIKDINTLKIQLRKDREEYTSLEKSFGGSESQERYAELLALKTQLSGEKEECEYNIAMSTDVVNNPYEESNLTLCNAAIELLKSEIGAGDEVVRKLSQCDRAWSLLDEIYKIAMINLKKHVINLTNETLYPILGEEIVVTNIDRSIKIKDKPVGSEGQVLTTGYAYITALFKDSEYKLPFIIDSPCGSLDLDKRAYVAKKIPKLFDQVVFLVTSSERLRFTDVLEKMEDLNPYTVWKDKENGKRVLKKSQNLDFFNSFQMEDEVE